MCEFKCNICVAEPFVSTRYEDWVTHLVSPAHQAEVEKKLKPRNRWRDEEDSFVLTVRGGGRNGNNGLPWKTEELTDWIAKFGVLTQILLSGSGHFCVFTLQSYGRTGKNRTSSLSSQKEFRGHALAIKPKSSYGQLEWNSLFDLASTHSTTLALVPPISGSSVPKGTFSSSANGGASPMRNDHPGSAPKEDDGPSSSGGGKKGRTRGKGKKKVQVPDAVGGDPPSQQRSETGVPGAPGNSSSGGIAVPPSSPQQVLPGAFMVRPPSVLPSAGSPIYDPPPQPPVPNIILSPVFTSQLSPEIAACLSNPIVATSNNPYKFRPLMPLYPPFLDLFQKLPEDNFAREKSNLYKKFQTMPLAEQLEEFFLAATLPFEEVRIRWQVIMDIMFLLRREFPHCELYAYGSFLTGLSDFVSDIDIYVDMTGRSCSPNPQVGSNKMSSHESVDRVQKIMRKSMCPHSKGRFVQMLIPVKTARVPILKLTHAATKINCDLSFENRLSVQSTKMLYFYLGLDSRIFRFMVLIRYWAKFHHLTGSNHIKNYALSLLVLVYLIRKGYVPPVELLRKLKAQERKKQNIGKNPDETEWWDGSFCDNFSLISKHFKATSWPASAEEDSQERSLAGMAIEFFDMFANLDLGKVVVCPLLGDCLPRTKFQPESEEALPDTLDRYKNWAAAQPLSRRLDIKTPLCVQDPFVLSSNVGSASPHATLVRFQMACAKGLQILREKNGLRSLLDVLVPLPAHIGDIQFMEAYKTEKKGEEIKKEINMVVRGNATEPEGQHSAAQTTQTTSYGTLPKHLQNSDTLSDEKGMKQSRRTRWEIFLDFSLCSQFEDLYVAELSRNQIQIAKRNIMDSLCSLWHRFTVDFLKEFFDRGLTLRVVDEKTVVVEPSASVASDGTRKRWKVKMLSKQEEELLQNRAERMGGRSEQDMKRLQQKIAELPSMPAVIEYAIVTYRVEYPFWENRSNLVDKVGKEMKPEDMLEIPILPTPKRGEDICKGDRNEHDEVWNCFNPVDLEARVSEIAAPSAKENVVPFNLTVLTKVDLSCLDDRPELFFIIEKDIACKSNPTEPELAVQCLSNILTEAFPLYQIYRLAQWLQMPAGRTTDTHPLHNPVVLTHLFEVCPSDLLANFRLVNKLWKQLSLKSWRSSVTITLYSGDFRGPYGRNFFWELPPSTPPRPTEFLTLMQKFLLYVQESAHDYKLKPFRQFCLHEWEFKDWDEQIEEFVQLCGPHVTVLELRDCRFHDSTAFRNVLFKWFPDLRRLTIKDCRWAVQEPAEPRLWVKPSLPPCKNLRFLELDVNHENLPISWMELFSMYPNIHTFNLYNADVGEAMEPMLNSMKIVRKHDPRMLQIKTMDIFSASLYAQERLPPAVCLLMRDLELPLENLTVDLGVDTPGGQVKDILEWHAPTLKYLNAYRGPISLPYLHFPFGIQLDNLQELVMSDRLAPNLKFLKWMPNLRKLTICDLVDDRPVISTEIVHNTEDRELEGWCLEKCLELRLEYYISARETTRLKDVMPNLEKLKMPLDHDQFKVVCLGWWDSLRELEILGHSLNDAVLTGLGTPYVEAFNKASGDGKDCEDVGEDATVCEPNVCNLKKLTKFVMANDNEFPTNLHDCSVYHGLLKLPDLQYIHLSAQVTDKALAALEAKVDYCKVNRFRESVAIERVDCWYDTSDSE